MGSGAESPHDGGAQALVLEELAALAKSQRRLEDALAYISKRQARASDVVDKMAADLSTVVDRLSHDPTAKRESGTARSSFRQQNGVHELRRPSERTQVSRELTGGREVEALDSSACETVSNGSEQERTMSDAGVGLPVGWPSSVAVRANSPSRSEMAGLTTEMSGLTKKATMGRTPPREDLEGAERREARGAFQRIIIDPNTNVHAAFTLCSTTVLIYDLIVVPFMLAWEVPFTSFTMVVSIGVACFWTLDVLVNFLSGYHRGGAMVMDPSRIARRYLSTWFLPDMALVVSDWLSILLAFASQGNDPSTEALSILRFTKLSRLLRVISIFRMVKIAVVFEAYMEKVVSDKYQFILKVAGVLCGTLWLGHILACLFYALGRGAPSNTGARWIDDVSTIGDRRIAFLDEGITYQYITSFHWTIAQVTLGSIGINVGNTSERLFSIFMLLLGLLFGATMVSSLSASMIDYQMLVKGKTEKLRVLRRYLRENRVDHNVAHLVVHQARERLWKSARLVAEDVQALGLLSVSLRTELHFGLCQQHIIRHPFFRFWADMDTSLARQFCSECVRFDLPMPEDDVFFPGTVTDTSYFVVFGKLNYTQVPGSSPATRVETTSVSTGQWLCEAAMWSHWIHVGTLQAETECQLLVVCAKELDSVLQRNRMLRDVTREYCKRFHARITSAKPPHAPWPNDISVPFTEYGDIVVCMDEAVQTTIGLAALEHMATWHRGFEKLRDEVQDGKSIMTINGNGDPERIVALVVMHIERRDGSIWAQLGEQKVDSDVTCACQLPGVKQQHDELVGETAMRILEHLGLGEQDVEILGMERAAEHKVSKQYGVRTKYLRTVCRARLRPGCSTSSMEAERLPEARRGRTSTSSSADSEWASARTQMPRPDIFVRRRGNKAFFSTWLTPAEFGQLQNPAREAVLAAWLAHGHALPPEEAGRGDLRLWVGAGRRRMFDI